MSNTPILAVLFVLSFFLSANGMIWVNEAQDPDLPITGVHEVIDTVDIINATGEVNITALLEYEDAEVKDVANNTISFIEFYTPWCFWCRQFAPVLSKLSEANQHRNRTIGDRNTTRLLLGKMNLDESASNLTKEFYNTLFFPTLLLVLPNGTYHIYPEEEERTVENMISFIWQYSGLQLVLPPEQEHLPTHTPGQVLRLTTQRVFDQFVFDGTLNVYVYFTAPWCSMCEILSPVWEAVAESQRGNDNNVVIAEVDIEQNPHLGEKYGITSLPTIKAFLRKDKSGKQVYSGYDEVPAIDQWILQTAHKPDVTD
eukprot:PhF_6_TR5708/c0_g1_i1/m.8410/K09584/PDIA6, TXNDC7; protein disulfide-isomerase A6